MITLYKTGAYLVNQSKIIADDADAPAALKKATGITLTPEQARTGTIAHSIIKAHNSSGSGKHLQLRFDSLTSHDITYVGIIQTARASGMEKFPIPYVLTNCHNSLCAVGGTINEDDHMFALSAAKKYGGIYLPTNLAVIHSYNREMMTGAGRMILGSDSHTRYGALGTMAVGEGGGELAKQLLSRTYDMESPQVVGVYLTGKPGHGVGPHDVALSIIGAVFKNGYVKNKVMEFIGDGIAALPVEYRNGIDVMTTETTCWSSIWCTDTAVQDYYTIHGRTEAYRELRPADISYYDGMIVVDMSDIEPVIALPFHPSNVYSIRELRANAADILHKADEESKGLFGGSEVCTSLASKLRGGEIYVDQGTIAGCSGGTFDNIVAAADILDGASVGNDVFTMSVYPASQPAYIELLRNGSIEKLMSAGVIIRECFCGPCFGAGDTPANGEFSIRHTTRNFPNREGSKPGEGQLASVALMDARSIAATAANGGRLTSATDIDVHYSSPKYFFDKSIYEKRVYNGYGKAQPAEELRFGPNIRDWPEIPALTDDILLSVVSYITDPVTTTDELIPSGEASSFRSNPMRLAEFTLSRKDPAYVGRAKAIHAFEALRERGASPSEEDELRDIYAKIKTISGYKDIVPQNVGIGSTIFANKPGDGSAREQAASCQRVLGAWANIAVEYATKRYRSNLINWGMLPFIIKDGSALELGSYVFIPAVRQAIENHSSDIKGYVIGAVVKEISLSLGQLTDDERKILLDGCLINFYHRG
ncbi:MAG: hydratase [Hydrogenoanaerobacterium sp.]